MTLSQTNMVSLVKRDMYFLHHSPLLIKSTVLVNDIILKRLRGCKHFVPWRLRAAQMQCSDCMLLVVHKVEKSLKPLICFLNYFGCYKSGLWGQLISWIGQLIPGFGRRTGMITGHWMQYNAGFYHCGLRVAAVKKVTFTICTYYAFIGENVLNILWCFHAI